GENGGGAGLAMFGAGMGAAGGMVGQAQPWSPPGQQAPQQQAPQQQAPQQAAPQQSAPAEAAPADPVAKLAQYKEMLDQGLITEADYEAAKKAAPGRCPGPEQRDELPPAGPGAGPPGPARRALAARRAGPARPRRAAAAPAAAAAAARRGARDRPSALREP